MALAVLKLNPDSRTSWVLEATCTGMYTLRLTGPLQGMKGYVSLTGKAVPVEEERRVSPGRDGAKIGDVLAYDCDGAQLFHRKPEYEFRPGIDTEDEQFDACPYPGRPGSVVVLTLKHATSGREAQYEIQMENSSVLRNCKSTIRPV